MELAPASTHSICADFDAHMARAGVLYSRWYVGITSDINDRLFGFHRVTDWYIYRRAFNDTDARLVEQAYHYVGCKGAGGGGDENSVFVYAYIITAQTAE